MARTKQTARMSTGGKPRQPFPFPPPVEVIPDQPISDGLLPAPMEPLTPPAFIPPPYDPHQHLVFCTRQRRRWHREARRARAEVQRLREHIQDLVELERELVQRGARFVQVSQEYAEEEFRLAELINK